MTAFEAICLIAAMVAALAGLIASPHTYRLPSSIALLVLLGPSIGLTVMALASLAMRTILRAL